MLSAPFSSCAEAAAPEDQAHHPPCRCPLTSTSQQPAVQWVHVVHQIQQCPSPAWRDWPRRTRALSRDRPRPGSGPCWPLLRQSQENEDHRQVKVEPIPATIQATLDSDGTAHPCPDSQRHATGTSRSAPATDENCNANRTQVAPMPAGHSRGKNAAKSSAPAGGSYTSFGLPAHKAPEWRPVEAAGAEVGQNQASAPRDLQMYLWSHSWRLSESECKSRNVQIQKPSMSTITLAFWSYKK